MPGNSSDGKHKRRPVGFQLTEDEINNFIAHGGDDEDSDESDWDDLGETNLSEVQYQKKAVQINTNPPKATSSSSTKSKVSERQDAGVDMLFDSSSGPNCVSEATKDDDHFLFGSDESDSETQGLDREEAGDDDDAIPLNEYGSQIQRCLNSAERRARGKLIDKEVEKAIEDSSSTSSSNAKSSTVSSISSALAACAARRKKAIAQLNNAHCPNNNAERTVKPSTALIANTSVPSATHTASTNSPDCWFALPTKLRVHRSRISSELWKQRTTDRQVMTLMQFMQNHRSNPVSNVLTKKSSRSTPSQVLVGVIGSKLPPRRSRNDRIYSVWCLSDLDHIGPGAPHGCVKLFLFGNSHEKLWKESEGTVIAVLGPRTMSDPMAGSSEKDVSITLESPMHVMILGHSPDFGVCAATSKSGQQCFHVINKYPVQFITQDLGRLSPVSIQHFSGCPKSRSVCRYCDVHVKKAYFEASTSRPGFATTQHPVFGKRPIRRNADTLSPMSYTSNFIRPVPETSTTTSFEFRTSFTSRVKLNAAKLSAAGYQFDPSIGLGSQSNSESTATLETSNASASITPTTNLSKRSSTVLSSPERKLIKALRRPSAGSLNLLRQLGLEQASGDGDTAAAQKVSHSSHKKSPQISPTKKSIPTFANFFSSLPKTKKTTSAPSLSTSAGFIDLGPIPSQNSVQHPSLAAARLRAAAVVQSQGGVQAMERQVKRRCLSEVVHTPSPNRPSPLSQILGRGKENTHDTLSTSPKTPVESKPPSDGIENISPTLLAKQKRIKQLEDLVRQGSAHTDLIIEAETQAEQSRLFSLEQRDEYHQKLTEQQEEPCTYVHCKTCGYRAWKAAPECSRCDHQLVYVKGTKRYFRCRNCAQRTITFERYPNHCCKNCGESLFEKTGILAERKQSILPGGKLLTRGYEEKHL